MPTTATTLCIRADASPTMGTGHVMRCLALALAARESGLGVRMIGRVQVSWVRERLQKEGINFTVLAGDVPERERPEDLLLQIQDTQKPDWIILDGYHFGPDCQNAVRQAGYRLLVIDDYNHLPEYHADILLNQNLGAEEFAYSGEVGQKLLGPRYALLRPEFALARKQAEKRIFPEKAQKLLLTLGGGDFSTHLLDIAPVLSLPEFADCTLRVISGAMPEEKIRKTLAACPAKLEILPCVGDMPALLLDTDLCITAGGSTCWELCCLGVPFLVTRVAENQDIVACNLSSKGFAPILSKESLCASLVGGRAHDSSRILTSLVDEKGVIRIVLEATGHSVFALREARIEDAQAVLELANDGLVRKNAFSTKRIDVKDHEQWYKERIYRTEEPFYVLYYKGYLVGYVRYDSDKKENAYVVTVAVSSEWRGMKIGTQLLTETTKSLRKHERVIAWVKPDNNASKKMFLNAGYAPHDQMFHNGMVMLCFSQRVQ